MKFQPAPLPGVWVIDLERRSDDRGFFARSWCEREFTNHGLNPRLTQCNISFNHQAGTLRGLHYQVAPYAEGKLVRCTQGAIYDVAVDLRPDSPTYCQAFGLTLSAETRTAVYIPEGCAHGFLTLTAAAEVFYQMTEFYAPEQGRGVRWDDPAFAVEWPAPVRVIAERDATYPDFQRERPPAAA